MKTEYPAQEKFDIAFIDETKYDKINDKIFKIWNNYVNICIEIKYWQQTDGAKGKFDSYSDDIKKLINYQKEHYENDRFLGLAILFVQFDREQALTRINRMRKKTFKENITNILTNSEDKIELNKDDKIYNYIVFKDHINSLQPDIFDY